MTAKIEFESVSYAKGGREIIAPLSLSLTEQRVGVVGRNGSGKSTFARLMAGLIAPDSGTIRVCGVDVWKDRKDAVGVIGVLFQNPDHQILFPTVQEELAFGLRQLGQDKSAATAGAHAVLERFGRGDWAERTTHGLSQGQRHLVCLMAVLAMAPRVIVLDEPFAGLDLPTRMHLGRELDGLSQTVVQITHQTETLRDYDRVLWIDAGRIAADGPPEQVLPCFEAEMLRRGDGDALADI